MTAALLDRRWDANSFSPTYRTENSRCSLIRRFPLKFSSLAGSRSRFDLTSK
jgi:hypothetical protein